MKRGLIVFIFSLCALASLMTCTKVSAAFAEPPPDPGFEISVLAADAIVEVKILAGGPFRAVATAQKILKGKLPPVFEIEDFNSYNWDTVHHGFETGARELVFLSVTGRDSVYATLTPSAPRLGIENEGVMLALGDPPFRIPVKAADLEEGISLLLETPGAERSQRAVSYAKRLCNDGGIESRYLGVAMAGGFREAELASMLIPASKDKLLKMRLTAIEALGKCPAPEASATLRALLKDEKATVSREAARALLAKGSADALPDLLEWSRKALASKTASSSTSGVSATGSGNTQSEAAAQKAYSQVLETLSLAERAGVFLSPKDLERPLLDLARSSDNRAGRAALEAYGAMAGPEQLAALEDFANDKTNNLSDRAEIELRKYAMRTFKDMDEFRSWRTREGGQFGEDKRREIAENAAAGLEKTEKDKYDDRARFADTLRSAPPGIALVSMSPNLFKDTTYNTFDASDLAQWESPLALPYLLERVAHWKLTERKDAYIGMAKICLRHPRLGRALWPLLKAGLTERDGSIRGVALEAAGLLRKTDSIPALLDAVNARNMSESILAGKALYTVTARNFGFSPYEPIPDQNQAREHLKGWYAASKITFNEKLFPAPVTDLTWPANPRIYEDLEAGERRKKLEQMLTGRDSRGSAAAFGVLHGELPAGDPLWAGMIAQGRVRDRASGALGLFGGIEKEGAALFKIPSDKTAPPIMRALALCALPGLTRENAGATLLNQQSGANAVIAFIGTLKAPGDSTEDDRWRRLALMSLGLADNDPASLTVLRDALNMGLAAEPLDPDVGYNEEPSPKYRLIRPALFALCARSDSTNELMLALNSGKEESVREVAARELGVRRHRPAIAGIFAALEKTAARGGWQELCKAAQPMLDGLDAAAMIKLFDSETLAARGGAAWLYVLRNDLAEVGGSKAKLIEHLSDKSSFVRLCCAETLGKLRVTAALKDLVRLLDDDDSEVRSTAAEAIGNIGDPDACKLATIASEQQTRVDARWLKAMAIAGADDQSKLLDRLSKSNLYTEQRAGLEAIAASSGAPATVRLLEAFHKTDVPLQTVAGDLLAARGDRAVQAVLPDLTGNDPSAKAMSIHLLSRGAQRAGAGPA